MKEAVHISRNPSTGPDLQELVSRVALGDEEAFSGVFDAVSGGVLGVVRAVVRDQAQSEEVAQEVLVEVWRTAPRYRPERGTAMNWILTLAHRRAVDRVRSVEAAALRDHKAALLERVPEYDEVVEHVEARLEREQVRRCLRTLTEIQRQAVTLAYYRGLTYREVAEALAVPLGTVKTRLRDGLIRLRDCLGGDRVTTTDLHRLTGAYALHALSDDEGEAFERHLAGCEACAQETAELRETAVRLGLAVAAEPSPELRAQVLRKIGTVRQQTPGTPGNGLPVRVGPRARTLSRWALAVCLAGVVGLGGTAVWQHQQARDAQEQARRATRAADGIAAVLTAPDTRTRAARLAGGAAGSVVVSRSLDKAVFAVSGMASPPSGKVYQLWFDDDGTMRSAGLMNPGRSQQTVLLKGTVDGASGMGVTVEPTGGSKHPTSAPIALMSFPG